MYKSQRMSKNISNLSVRRMTSSLRRLFITQQEKIGKCPEEAAKGDKVCIFQGVGMPFVLRPKRKEGQWVIIGACYVNDLMHGKALRDIEAGTRQWEEFEIV